MHPTLQALTLDIRAVMHRVTSVHPCMLASLGMDRFSKPRTTSLPQPRLSSGTHPGVLPGDGNPQPITSLCCPSCAPPLVLLPLLPSSVYCLLRWGCLACILAARTPSQCPSWAAPNSHSPNMIRAFRVPRIRKDLQTLIEDPFLDLKSP